jgi:hypothetical protein
MDAGEKLDVVKECAGKRINCFPLPEGVSRRTNRAFRSYSLFLVSNVEWLGLGGDEKLRALYTAYEAFSRAIGNDHAAVFFWKKTPAKKDRILSGADLASQLDVSRCTEFARVFQLELTASPHLVVLRSLPDPKKPPEEAVVLQLNGLSPDSTIKLLGELAGQLAKDNIDQASLDSARWWLTWRDVFRSVFDHLGVVVAHTKVKIKTAVIDIEMDGHK